MYARNNFITSSKVKTGYKEPCEDIMDTEDNLESARSYVRKNLHEKLNNESLAFNRNNFDRTRNNEQEIENTRLDRLKSFTFAKKGSSLDRFVMPQVALDKI